MRKEKKQELLAILLAKLGVFFSFFDGEYNPREKNFIQNFVFTLLNNQIITDEAREIIEEIENKHYSIDDIIQDSQQFSQNLDEEEREPCLLAIESYIENLIEADDVIHPAETENFNLWKRAVLNK